MFEMLADVEEIIQNCEDDYERDVIRSDVSAAVSRAVKSNVVRSSDRFLLDKFNAGTS